MGSPYQEFVRKAKERFEARQKNKKSGPYQFTRHARYKMQQYGLSEQRVRSVIRNPKRKEEGIVPKTVAYMQPVSVKMVYGKPARLPETPGVSLRAGNDSREARSRSDSGREVWKQEIWVMIVHPVKSRARVSALERTISQGKQIKIISAWRYPGVSPKRSPIPDEILQELGDLSEESLLSRD